MLQAPSTTLTANSWALVSAGEQRWWILEGPFRRTSEPDPTGCSLWHSPFASREFLESGGLPWALPTRAQKVDAGGLRVWLRQRYGASASGGSPRLRGTWIPPSFETFRESFSTLMVHLSRGELAKGVPLTCARWVPCSPLRPHLWHAWVVASVMRLPAIEACTGAAGYVFVDDQGAGFVGATPELLFEVREGTTLRTAALAATRLSGRDGSEIESPAFRSPREEAEHDLVLDHLRQRLARFGSVEVGERQARAFGRIFHLETPVVVRLHDSGVAPSALVRALHPTPALGTSPVPDESAIARRWLNESASLGGTRGEFGAPFGVWDGATGGGRILVGIRQVRFSPTEGGFHVPAGCGVVAGSLLDEEWAEAKAKIAAVNSLFFPSDPIDGRRDEVVGRGEASYG